MGRHSILVLLFLLLLFDMASTAYAVRRWGFEHEANPLFRFLFERGSRSQVLIVDIATIALVMAVAYFTPKDVAFVLAIVFAALALNNMATIARLEWSTRAGSTAVEASGASEGAQGRRRFECRDEGDCKQEPREGYDELRKRG